MDPADGILSRLVLEFFDIYKLHIKKSIKLIAFFNNISMVQFLSKIPKSIQIKMLSTVNTTEMITAIAEQHITEAIVNAAKGKTNNKRTKKLSLSDEIKACFDIEKFLNNAATTIEELISRKVEEAVAAATSANAEKPKKKRAPAKKATVTDSDGEAETEAVPSDEEAKPKKKRAPKKVTIEASVQATDDAPVEASLQASDKLVEASLQATDDASVEASVEGSVEASVEVEAPKPKKVRVTKKATVEASVEATKPKEKTARVTKKDKEVEVSDSDASDSEKPKKKRTAKKVTTPVLPEDQNQEPEEPVNEPIVEIEDDSSIATTDFIRPLSISNELEEEELSDIEEEE